jgi:YegS/Rv2252/BmrU family lipid kinase
VRALLVVNPQARRGDQLGRAARNELRRLNVALVEEPAAREFDAIVVVGGDGSVARQIPRALALDVPIGLVPAGTFNDLARTLAIPLEVEAACAAIAAGRTRAIDIAHVNGAYYATEASIGISSRIARLQRPAEKQRFGVLALVASALQVVGSVRPFHVEIAFDGERRRVKTIQLTVANSQHFGGLLTVDDASIDDGWLDLYSIEIESLLQLFSVAGAMLARKRRPARGLRTYRAKSFTITSRRPHRITADAEPAGTTPARFEVVPKALRVFTP